MGKNNWYVLSIETTISSSSTRAFRVSSGVVEWLVLYASWNYTEIYTFIVHDPFLKGIELETIRNVRNQHEISRNFWYLSSLKPVQNYFSNPKALPTPLKQKCTLCKITEKIMHFCFVKEQRK
jgi:hypothetical protein